MLVGQLTALVNASEVSQGGRRTEGEEDIIERARGLVALIVLVTALQQDLSCGREPCFALRQ